MNSVAAALLAASVFGLTQLGLVLGTIPEVEPEQYSEVDQHALVDPTVVRILHHVQGDIVVTPFTVDMDTLLAVPDSSLDEPVSEHVDEHVSGTGFSVSEQGLFVTNAHVVSSEYVRFFLGIKLYETALMNAVMKYVYEYGEDSPQAKALEEELLTVKASPGGEKAKMIAKSILEHVTIENNESSVVVLEQGAREGTTGDLYAAGKEVEIVEIPKDWITSQNDVALLKVKGTSSRVPAVSLATTTQIEVNTPIAVYGFPGSTDLSTTTTTSVTVTRGTVTSIKRLPGTSIDTVQVDAKVSRGSSGGPVVDAQGRVAAIITLETGSEDGDNFGFSLPVSLIQDLLEDAGITELTTKYQSHLRKGLALQDEKHCKRAIESFKDARLVTDGNDRAQQPVDRLIAECDEMIAAGLSIDSGFDEFLSFFRGIDAVAWMIIVGGVVLCVVLVVGGVFLSRAMKKNRMLIRQNQQALLSQKPTGDMPKPTNPAQTSPNELLTPAPPHKPVPTPESPLSGGGTPSPTVTAPSSVPMAPVAPVAPASQTPIAPAPVVSPPRKPVAMTASVPTAPTPPEQPLFNRVPQATVPEAVAPASPQAATPLSAAPVMPKAPAPVQQSTPSVSPVPQAPQEVPQAGQNAQVNRNGRFAKYTQARNR